MRLGLRVDRSLAGIVAGLAVAGLALTACTSSGSTTATPTGSTSATVSAGPSSTPSSNTAGDWTLASYKLKDNGLGSFGGTARITYDGDDPQAHNTFTLIISTVGTDSEKSVELGEALGSIASIAPGQTKAVQLVSTDDFVPGPYSVEFKKDL